MDTLLYEARIFKRFIKRKDIAAVSGIMASKTGDDWFEALDAELEKKTEQIVNDVTQSDKKREDTTMGLLGDMWRIWLRFNRINVPLRIEPDAYSFAKFKTYPNDWELKSLDEFDYGSLNAISLIDVSPTQSRTGDALKIVYYDKDGESYVKIIFEFCEGEHYYKYAGWKRIFVQYILYEAPVKKAKLDDIHKIMGDVIKAWYESHLRKNREIILDHIRSKYVKGEEFPQ